MGKANLVEPHKIRYDASDWPIFRVVMPSGALSTEALREHLDHVSAVAERREPFGMLIDALRAPSLNAAQRQLVAAQLRFDARRFPGVIRAIAVCLSGTLARGGFTAINWLARPPYPMAAFESMAKASVWLERELEVPTSPHMRHRSATP